VLDILYLSQTANLDGETNLKIRKALEKTWDYLLPEKAYEFKGFYMFIFFHLDGSLFCRWWNLGNFVFSLNFA
jgi:hypothetical protein